MYSLRSVLRSGLILRWKKYSVRFPWLPVEVCRKHLVEKRKKIAMDFGSSSEMNVCLGNDQIYLPFLVIFHRMWRHLTRIHVEITSDEVSCKVIDFIPVNKNAIIALKPAWVAIKCTRHAHQNPAEFPRQFWSYIQSAPLICMAFGPMLRYAISRPMHNDSVSIRVLCLVQDKFWNQLFLENKLLFNQIKKYTL